MMKNFMDNDFLLETDYAKILYHEHAAHMPIVDYHCHISPKEIAEDCAFSNMTQLWLGGDHYKWRLMRANGIEEQYITGDADDRDKFQMWAKTLSRAVGNPLYHWSHLELQRYFGYYGTLDENSSQYVWELCNERLKDADMYARGLVSQSGVALLCTTDDPADDLRYHKMLREDQSFAVQVIPSFRPEAAMNLRTQDFGVYMERLGEAAEVDIQTFSDLKQAIVRRIAFFDAMGCRTSDHSLDYAMYVPAKSQEVEHIFARALRGEEVSYEEELKYRTAFLLFVAKEYQRLGWVMQIHYGVRRNNNGKQYRALGADTGFDCINDHTPSAQFAALLDALNEQESLPRTIVYSLNPTDNAAIGSVIGCFSDSTCAGKIQQGSAWWFNDNKQGMIDQMTSVANLGLLANFVGMLTDSRSFLSYTRHEYFRRILCNLIGEWVARGEYPWDEKRLGTMVEDIAYRNAVLYFGFDLPLV